jgi:hypothetical protein
MQDLAAVAACAGALTLYLDGTDLGEEGHARQRGPEPLPLCAQLVLATDFLA